MKTKFLRSKFSYSDWTKKSVMGVVVLGYMVSVIGWSPVTMIAKDAAMDSNVTPYPCQGCACSCSSALQCWTNCCCFSLDERKAWASERGIEIPVEGVAAAKTVDKSKCSCNCQSEQPIEKQSNEPQIQEATCFPLMAQWYAFRMICVESSRLTVYPPERPDLGVCCTKNCGPARISSNPPEHVPIRRSPGI